ncbi:putative methionine transporter, NhaC family [Ferrimonas balearica DSM 9799]|uniref:Putative methionine transporter, NhaC family n=1 Tax=Ferrimonas balearica (strain DSM 9799 / CCM 4581 / KCTC 23876 / PAT) TaxID=550540 RepID=E1SQI1_FERBD|nr:Na+/H+ antiporter NhaC family protein [Ferrimonas balearica]ADN74793.1 putative methionine transporter, NhaC family [Ferrimonas balearica DSM 9799]MBW3165425.1 Na+/H+ antiporter NhaC family protein [Ferrimonas balearica]
MSQTQACPANTAIDTPNATPLALLPLVLFLVLFVGTGSYLTYQGVEFAFYELSPVIAILPAIVLALTLGALKFQQPLETGINTFIKGIGDNNIIAMCLIYLLAGGFAAVVSATGGVDATVALGLTLIPASLLLPGIFLISAFISTAMGTSMGTIAAVAPVALGIAQQTGIDTALMAGVVLSGAMFGDNLSIISDTTIAATRTQGAQMKDKFRENIRIAAPAALVAVVLFAIAGSGKADIAPQEFDLIKVLPYLAILVLAVIGINVFVVLSLGIVLAALTAFVGGDYSLMTLGKDLMSGFAKMQEIFILSMLVGGLAALMSAQGGLAWLTDKVAAMITRLSRRGNSAAAELGMGALVASTNACVANNTVSIIVAGPVARSLAEQNSVAPRRAAATLDIFACIIQGLIPYGAQALLLAATFSLSPIAVVAQGWYCMLLTAFAIGAILWRGRQSH